MSETYYSIRLRRDTAANWTSANPILALGEIGLVTDTNPQQLKFGDGSSRWNVLATQYFLTSDIEDILQGYVSKNQVQQSVGDKTDLPMSQKAVTDLFEVASVQPVEPVPNSGDPSTIQYPRDYIWPSYDSGHAVSTYYLTAALGWNLDYRLNIIESAFSLDTVTDGQVLVYNEELVKFVPTLFAVPELVDVQLDENTLSDGQVLVYHAPEVEEGETPITPYWTNETLGSQFGTVIIDQEHLVAGQTLVYTVPAEGQPYWTNASAGGSLTVANTAQTPTVLAGITKVIFENAELTSLETGIVQVSLVSTTSTLAGLSDVNIVYPSDGQVLKYVSGAESYVWSNASLNITDLGDTNISTTPTVNDVLTWNGTYWVAASLGSGSGSYRAGNGIVINTESTPNIISFDTDILGSGLAAALGKIIVSVKSNGGIVSDSNGLSLATSSANVLPSDVNSPSSTSGKYYPVQVNSNDGSLFVNVPWS